MSKTALLEKAQRLSQTCAIAGSNGQHGPCPVNNPICDTKHTLCGYCHNQARKNAETAQQAARAQQLGCCMNCGTPTNRARHSGEFYQLCKHCQWEVGQAR